METSRVYCRPSSKRTDSDGTPAAQFYVTDIQSKVFYQMETGTSIDFDKNLGCQFINFIRP